MYDIHVVMEMFIWVTVLMGPKVCLQLCDMHMYMYTCISRYMCSTCMYNVHIHVHVCVHVYTHLILWLSLHSNAVYTTSWMRTMFFKSSSHRTRSLLTSMSCTHTVYMYMCMTQWCGHAYMYIVDGLCKP